MCRPRTTQTLLPVGFKSPLSFFSNFGRIMVPNKRVYLLDVVCAIIHVRTTATRLTVEKIKKFTKHLFIITRLFSCMHGSRHKFVLIPTRPCKKILPIVAGMNMSLMFLNISKLVCYFTLSREWDSEEMADVFLFVNGGTATTTSSFSVCLIGLLFRRSLQPAGQAGSANASQRRIVGLLVRDFFLRTGCFSCHPANKSQSPSERQQ